MEEIMDGRADGDVEAAGRDGRFADSSARAGLSLIAAAELQDDLLAACGDLERLEALMADACGTLLAAFSSASAATDKHTSTGMAALKAHLDKAVTALQFQDMAVQLMAHTRSRLGRCSDRIAMQALGSDPDDEDGDVAMDIAPLRASPVSQDQMAAGSVELF